MLALENHGDRLYLMEIARRPDAVMVEGRGSWLTDANGRRYLDFIQGWAVNSLGHCPPVIVEAITRQAVRLINAGPAFFNDRAIELARLIATHSFGRRTFFANCGAEANEGAIKLARKWGQKFKGGAYQIVTMENGFHGRTLATMSASGKPQWRDLYEPKVPGFVKVPLNDFCAVESAINDSTVAVMLEPIQGEAGVHLASDEFLRQLRDLTERRRLLLIFDEIQTGMGRTGTLFGYEQTGVVPDVMTLGKGLGGGLPIAALVAREEVCCFEAGDQGGTFNGNPLVCAGGVAVLQELTRPGFLANTKASGQYLQDRLRQLSARHGQGEVRGRGLLLALALKGLSGPRVVEAAAAAGLLINSPREDTLRFLPALNVSVAEIDTAMTILDDVFEALRRSC
jgi:acetylornithine/N-succinyldiaminopimelate aminotransferase